MPKHNPTCRSELLVRAIGLTNRFLNYSKTMKDSPPPFSNPSHSLINGSAQVLSLTFYCLKILDVNVWVPGSYLAHVCPIQHHRYHVTAKGNEELLCHIVFTQGILKCQVKWIFLPQKFLCVCRKISIKFLGIQKRCFATIWSCSHASICVTRWWHSTFTKDVHGEVFPKFFQYLLPVAEAGTVGHQGCSGTVLCHHQSRIKAIRKIVFCYLPFYLCS